uniref:Uncharacterized protein n=1 Tax=Buteo japonicus TaxID=224669 RepID=A0A8C0B2N4_9AVES
LHCIESYGRQERVMFDKITSRIQKLCYGLNADFVDPVSLSFFLLSCSLPLVISAKPDSGEPVLPSYSLWQKPSMVACAGSLCKCIHNVFLLIVF